MKGYQQLFNPGGINASYLTFPQAKCLDEHRPVVSCGAGDVFVAKRRNSTG